MVKKASGDLMANAGDWRVGVNLIGLTNFISTLSGPNVTIYRVSVKCGPDDGGWRMADGGWRMVDGG